MGVWNTYSYISISVLKDYGELLNYEMLNILTEDRMVEHEGEVIEGDMVAKRLCRVYVIEEITGPGRFCK